MQASADRFGVRGAGGDREVALEVRDGRAGRARLYTRTNDSAAYRELFEAMPPVLPGLAAAPSFAF